MILQFVFRPDVLPGVWSVGVPSSRHTHSNHLYLSQHRTFLFPSSIHFKTTECVCTWMLNGTHTGDWGVCSFVCLLSLSAVCLCAHTWTRNICFCGFTLSEAFVEQHQLQTHTYWKQIGKYPWQMEGNGQAGMLGTRMLRKNTFTVWQTINEEDREIYTVCCVKRIKRRW